MLQSLTLKSAHIVMHCITFAHLHTFSVDKWISFSAIETTRSKKCSKAPNVTNARIYYEAREIKSEIIHFADLYCSEKYILLGSPRVYCIPTKGWKEPYPRCRGKGHINAKERTIIIRQCDI